MSAYEAWARDHVEQICREAREEPDEDRELTESAIADAEELWGIK